MKKRNFFQRNFLPSRSLHELYKCLYEFMEPKVGIEGICSQISKLFHKDYISHYEVDILREHFESQKPTNKLHPEFFEKGSNSNRVYWWHSYNRFGYNADNKRKEFILKMIHITKEYETESWIQKLKNKFKKKR